ncbi:MAG: hypothetical protein AAGI71_08690 [Bacteroidota bacterium]
MRYRPALLALVLGFALTGLAACSLLFEGDDPLNPFGSPPEMDLDSLQTCAQIDQALQAEAGFVQACGEDADCGLVLPQTSCGCTRNLVARLGVDTTRFYTLLERGQALECNLEIGGPSTCDCPPADGFVCVDGQCQWNYLTDTVPDLTQPTP